MTMIADSFKDDAPTLDDLSPRTKVAMFIAGMRDNAIDLVTFRCDPELRAIVGEHETSLWQALNALQLVLTSIRVEHETKSKLRVVK